MISADEAVAKFVSATETVLALVGGIAEPSWSVAPPDDEWCPAEIVEHVVLTDRATLTRLQDPTRGTPMAGVTRMPDAQIVEGMFRGVPAPPGAGRPTGRLATRADAVAALLAVRDGVVDCARTRGDRLREIGFPHPVFGPFDGVQWVLFLAAHTENHLADLRHAGTARR